MTTKNSKQSQQFPEQFNAKQKLKDDGYEDEPFIVKVSGFPLNIDLSEIQQYMMSMLPIKQFTVASDGNNKFCGFVFVSFKDEVEAINYMMDKSYYKEKNLNSKIVVDYDEFILCNLKHLRTGKKIFIDKIPKTVTEEELRISLIKFGKVDDLLLLCRENREFQFGFVTYQNQGPAIKLANIGEIDIGLTEKIFADYARVQFSPKMMSRIHYDIRDYLEDVEDGYITYDADEFFEIYDSLQPEFLREEKVKQNKKQKVNPKSKGKQSKSPPDYYKVDKNEQSSYSEDSYSRSDYYEEYYQEEDSLDYELKGDKRSDEGDASIDAKKRNEPTGNKKSSSYVNNERQSKNTYKSVNNNFKNRQQGEREERDQKYDKTKSSRNHNYKDDYEKTKKSNQRNLSPYSEKYDTYKDTCRARNNNLSVNDTNVRNNKEQAKKNPNLVKKGPQLNSKRSIKDGNEPSIDVLTHNNYEKSNTENILSENDQYQDYYYQNYYNNDVDYPKHYGNEKDYPTHYGNEKDYPNHYANEKDYPNHYSNNKDYQHPYVNDKDYQYYYGDYYNQGESNISTSNSQQQNGYYNPLHGSNNYQKDAVSQYKSSEGKENVQNYKLGQNEDYNYYNKDGSYHYPYNKDGSYHYPYNKDQIYDYQYDNYQNTEGQRQNYYYKDDQESAYQKYDYEKPGLVQNNNKKFEYKNPNLHNVKYSTNGSRQENALQHQTNHFKETTGEILLDNSKIPEFYQNDYRNNNNHNLHHNIVGSSNIQIKQGPALLENNTYVPKHISSNDSNMYPLTSSNGGYHAKYPGYNKEGCNEQSNFLHQKKYQKEEKVTTYLNEKFIQHPVNEFNGIRVQQNNLYENPQTEILANNQLPEKKYADSNSNMLAYPYQQVFNNQNVYASNIHENISENFNSLTLTDTKLNVNCRSESNQENLDKLLKISTSVEHVDDKKIYENQAITHGNQSDVTEMTNTTI